jgi:ferrous iron transport protein B
MSLPSKPMDLQLLSTEKEVADLTVALAGNPNTGKSTVFNNLTGLRQHTGNWPGKTVGRAEGRLIHDGQSIRVIDLPGTYSLLSEGRDEEIARDFVLFGRPDVIVVVVDATRLERNLNLVLQIRQVSGRVVVCLNLMDEARRKGILIDVPTLESSLGVPVVATAARRREGMDDLLEAIAVVASSDTVAPIGITVPENIQKLLAPIEQEMEVAFPGLPNKRWSSIRLLEGDRSLLQAIEEGSLAEMCGDARPSEEALDHLLQASADARMWAPVQYHDSIVEAIFAEASKVAGRAIVEASREETADRRIDQILTSRLWGFPVMGLLLAIVLWVTITGANVPSALLASVLIEEWHPALRSVLQDILPWWLTGALVDGCYLSLAWVISVMLPPMAIFFPLFTLLEDFGYLPRVAFNLDGPFRWAGAHGKQALTACMGFGCNAAGIVSCRIIDSPRERLIAIITNNFSLCNGRWPTQILIATVFVGAVVPEEFSGLAAALAVFVVASLGLGLMLIVSFTLSRTLLKGEASAFSLELPPYRPPRILQTVYTSLIDRTLFVLWRAIVFAAPAGIAIWAIANIEVAGGSLAVHVIDWLEPLGWLIGLNGVILLAYLVAIPANEIVIPTILMLTVLTTRVAGSGSGAGVMFEPESYQVTGDLLVAGGWTVLTAVNMMLFCLVHNPCSTTLYTIWRETGSAKWTTVSGLLPLAMGLGICALTAFAWRAAFG